MILDTSQISLTDGSRETAIDLYPGHELISFVNSRPARARVVEKNVTPSSDVMALVLSNGQKLVGSRDQKVAVQRAEKVIYKNISNVMIGEILRGEMGGRYVTVKVTGLVFYPREQKRLVALKLDHEKDFVAEGVLCRS